MKVVVGLAVLSGVLWAAGERPGPGAVHPEGPPPGHTGGFDEPTCQSCHTGYALDLPGGTLSVEGVPVRWEPGAEYVLTVVLRSEDMGAAGFQLSARTPDGLPAGRWSTLDDRVAVDVVGDTVPPGAYARQTRVGSAVDDPGVVSWRLVWRAPLEAAEVWFHGAANSGNGDNSPLGDLVYTTSLATRAAATSR